MNSTADCLLPAPPIYGYFMHYSHVVSVSLYIIVIIAIYMCDKGKLHKVFRRNMLINFLINFVTEIYMSELMLPVKHVSLPLFRTTGWLTYFGVNGRIQYEILANLIMLGGWSIGYLDIFRLEIILEMDKEKQKLKILKYGLWAYMVLAALHVIVSAAAYLLSIGIIDYGKKELLKSPRIPPEMGCPSVLLAVSDNYIPLAFIVYYNVMASLMVAIVWKSTKYLRIRIRSLDHMTSKELIATSTRSTVAQAVIDLMFLVPIFVQTFAIYFDIQNDAIAHFQIWCFTYHGIVTCLGLIIFSKAIRMQCFNMFKWSTYRPSQVTRVES